MIESIKTFLGEPVPNWLFWAAIAYLLFRDKQLKNGLTYLARILDQHHIEWREEPVLYD
jgi:hypothetical protein